MGKLDIRLAKIKNIKFKGKGEVKMAGYCKVCLKPLEDAQWSKDDQYKSCPSCSTANGNEHVYYKCAEFGFTDKRVTCNNPDGI